MKIKTGGYFGIIGLVCIGLLCGYDKKEEKAEVTGIYIHAPGAWVGDVMAYADEEGLQLNYLYDTDYNGIAYHPIHRFTTKNLYEYTNEGEIIPFGTELEAPDLAVGTGSFIRSADGIYHCFYTGHNDKAAELGIDKECIMHAVSLDNQTWKKKPEDTFYAPNGYSSNDFRDPQVFWNEEKKCYYMLVGARMDGKNGGIVALYTSDNLSDWALQSPFYEQEELYFLECPDVFQMGDYYYLVYSWNNVTYYRMARSMEGPWIKPQYDVFDGNAFYAGKTVEYEGKRYLFGFINRKRGAIDSADYQWAGSICAYELVQKEDNTLGAVLPSQLSQDYLTKKWKPEKMEFIGEALADGDDLVLNGKKGSTAGIKFGKLPATWMMSGSVMFDEDAQYAGFFFGDEGDYESAYGIVLDKKNGVMRYDKTCVKDAEDAAWVTYSEFNFEAGKKYEFKIVAEDEVIVISMDDTKVLSNRIYQAVGNGFGLFVPEGRVTFHNLSMYVPK